MAYARVHCSVVYALYPIVLSNLDQPTLRRARVSALVAAAQPFQYQQSQVLMVIGTDLSTDSGLPSAAAVAVAASAHQTACKSVSAS
jgi:hypothetical protein